MRRNPNDQAGVVCGILSIIFGAVAFLFCPPLFGLAGFVLGILSVCFANNKAAGIIGIVLSIFGAVVGMILGAAVAVHNL